MTDIVLTDIGCHRGGREVLSGVSLRVEPGRLLALVGPNGAGKSTLLALMCGDLPLSSGEVLIGGRPLRQWSASELARERAVLLQSNEVSFGFTGRQVVEMGRNPWSGRPEADEDEQAVDEAMTAADVHHLAHRPFSTLSGGERARVSLARVLAQRTATVLLDEPTAALDLRHQEEIMTLARRLTHEGKAVIVVLHDLSLAAAYADQIAVIANGTLGTVGSPTEVLTPQLVRCVYGVDAHLLTSPDGHLVVVPDREFVTTPPPLESS
ncbi:heme ABC transporter ATP-binding protein [Janibacter cremeus]|uniref:Iron complex transport system ATP-binding protein n=1 Tax=Janibacter cremeus TaxID=1285192 RepID=A0A852VPA1_9MICO|nr:heme ABC transporter ATP-binding protein [Janibacter cremeus]NYF97290.1 iron complex transport system ATP-binding protein [Janibacter cremeus]